MRQIIMTKKIIAAAARLAAVAGLGAATTVLAVDLTKLPPASTQKGVTYDKDIQPIFKASCFDCHGEKNHRNDLRLDSLAAALKGSKDNAQVIVPGKSDKSDLVINICWEAGPEHPMPPKPRPPRGANAGPNAGGPVPPPAGPGGPGGPPRKELTPDQIGLIRAWIDQGAK
jgi:hypothetical protein